MVTKTQLKNSSVIGNVIYIDCVAVCITSFHNYSCVDTATTVTLKTHNVNIYLVASHFSTGQT